MWKSKKEWQALVAGWVDSKFSDINVTDINNVAEKYVKIPFRISGTQKFLKSSPWGDGSFLSFA